MTRSGNIVSIIKAAHDRGNDFVLWKCRPYGNSVVLSVTLPAPMRKEAK